MAFNERKSMSLEDYVAEVKSNLGDPVDERWWVEEYFPSREDIEGYIVPERIHQKSSYFESEEQAQSFMNASRTTFPETKLRVRHQRCYERIQRYWI